MKIVVIGAGNVGTNLINALRDKHDIVQIVSKTEHSARKAALKFNTDYTTKLDNVNKDSDVYIISVNDTFVQDVAGNIAVENKIILHTAGSMDLDTVKTKYNNYGVFYPLQTFSKNKLLDFSDIPLCIEANNKNTEKIICELASSISSKVFVINSEQRKYIHLAAVFVCNFTNHLYNISYQILKNKGLDFDLLKPLISETADKVLNILPADAQTGPAVRKDEIIIEKHLKLLLFDTKLQKIYKDLTNNIIETHTKYGEF